ncbi:MAG: uncharacterized membrane protein YoaK (UPF0700 family) [Francisellaceae bacterium]|jgi:uncharacterized membrane protein YoaK (UPF0700 family)
MVMLVRNSYRATFAVTMAFLFNAGWVDSIVLYNVYNESVTYVTGNFSSVGDAIATHNIFFMFNIFMLIFGFIGGATVSGIILRTQNLYFDKTYGWVLILQAIFTLIGLLLMNQSGYKVYVYYDLMFLSFAMGMQNATTSIYSGGLARTTHLTGTTTDFGIHLGRWMARKAYDGRKLFFYFSSMIMFAVGSAAGAFWSHHSDHNYLYLLLPSILIPLAYGVYYIFFNERSRKRRFAS